MALDSSTFKKMFTDASGARKPVEARWAENFNLWVGRHWTAEEIEASGIRSPVVVPFTQGKILFLLSQVAESPPSWKVTPVEPSDQAAADLWEPLMPMIWRRARMGRKVRHLVQDALIYGVGILRPYWDPEMLGGTGDINVGVIDPQYFYPDPNAKDLYLEDAEYVILQYTVTREYVRERYGKLAKEYGREMPVLNRTGGEAVGPDYTFGDVGAAVSQYARGRRLTLFEVMYDGGKRIATFLGTPGQAENVFDRPSPFAYLNVNFDFGLGILPYIEETHDQWPHGLPEQTGSLNKYYEQTRAQVQESSRYAANAFYTGVRTEELKKLQDKSPKPGQLYLFATSEDAKEFKAHGGTPMIADGVWRLLQLCKYEMDSVTQVFDETQGKRPAGITSGKALRELRETAAGRPKMFLGQLSECLVDAGQVVMALAQLHYDTDRIVRLEGPQGAQRWDVAHRDRLAGQFDLECSVKPRFTLDEADMANLGLVLHERGLIGGLDLLTVLHWPNAQEALARAIKERAQMPAPAAGQQGSTRPALNTEGHQRGGEVV